MIGFNSKEELSAFGKRLPRASKHRREAGGATCRSVKGRES